MEDLNFYPREITVFSDALMSDGEEARAEALLERYDECGSELVQELAGLADWDDAIAPRYQQPTMF